MKNFRSEQVMSVLALLVFASPISVTQAQDDPAESSASELQLVAAEILAEMANHLASVQAFSVSVSGGYDAMQYDGQKIQFLESRDVTVARPGKMRIEEKGADGYGHLLLFDGATMTMADGDAGVFAQVAQPGLLDDAILYFIRDLGMRLPLAALFSSRFPQELEFRVRAIDYVEMSNALAEPTHQLVGRTDTVHFQVWVTDSERPVPLRMVLTYPDPGLPTYWAEFSGWNLKPKIRDALFAYKAPADAVQIPFAIQLSEVSDSAATGAAEPEGEQP